MRKEPSGDGTLAAVLAAWRDGVATVRAQPVLLLAALPTVVTWSSPTSSIPELLQIVTVQFSSAAAIWFVYRYRSIGVTPSPSTVGGIAARRLAVLVPFSLVHDAMTYTPLASLIGGIGTGDVPGMRPESRSILAVGIIGIIGFYLLMRLLLFPQVVTAEGGLWQPLQRAWALSAGRFWLLAIAVWLPWFLIPNLVIRLAYDVHPGLERIAASAVRPFELAMLTVLYMRLAPTVDVASAAR